MPDALPLPDWPALMTIEQACAYLQLGAGTFRSICPVRPLELGVALVRYRRADLDRWIAGLPDRRQKIKSRGFAKRWERQA